MATGMRPRPLAGAGVGADDEQRRLKNQTGSATLLTRGLRQMGSSGAAGGQSGPGSSGIQNPNGGWGTGPGAPRQPGTYANAGGWSGGSNRTSTVAQPAARGTQGGIGNPGWGDNPNAIPTANASPPIQQPSGFRQDSSVLGRDNRNDSRYQQQGQQSGAPPVAGPGYGSSSSGLTGGGGQQGAPSTGTTASGATAGGAPQTDAQGIVPSSDWADAEGFVAFLNANTEPGRFHFDNWGKIRDSKGQSGGSDGTHVGLPSDPSSWTPAARNWYNSYHAQKQPGQQGQQQSQGQGQQQPAQAPAPTYDDFNSYAQLVGLNEAPPQGDPAMQERLNNAIRAQSAQSKARTIRAMMEGGARGGFNPDAQMGAIGETSLGYDTQAQQQIGQQQLQLELKNLDARIKHWEQKKELAFQFWANAQSEQARAQAIQVAREMAKQQAADQERMLRLQHELGGQISDSDWLAAGAAVGGNIASAVIPYAAEAIFGKPSGGGGPGGGPGGGYNNFNYRTGGLNL